MRLPIFYPGIKRIVAPGFKVNGRMKESNRTGITIHYTADDNLDRVFSTLFNRGLGYHLIIDLDGVMSQYAPLDTILYHAGKSLWNDQRCNSTHVSIAVMSWGLLEKKNGAIVSWSGKKLGQNYNLRYFEGQWWNEFTATQNTTLFKFLEWAVSNGVDPDDICGHHECALPQGRKVDPGDSLKMTMAEVRSHLHR